MCFVEKWISFVQLLKCDGSCPSIFLLYCREEAVYGIRLWQMSPDGTLTLVLSHYFSVYCDVMYEQMLSIEATCFVVEICFVGLG